MRRRLEKVAPSFFTRLDPSQRWELPLPREEPIFIFRLHRVSNLVAEQYVAPPKWIAEVRELEPVVAIAYTGAFTQSQAEAFLREEIVRLLSPRLRTKQAAKAALKGVMPVGSGSHARRADIAPEASSAAPRTSPS